MRPKRNYIKNLKLAEISTVDNPAQAAAVATIMKSDQGESVDVFIKRVGREAAERVSRGEAVSAMVAKAEAQLEAAKPVVSAYDMLRDHMAKHGGSTADAMIAMSNNRAFLDAYERHDRESREAQTSHRYV